MSQQERMSIDDVNAHLGANILAVIEWLGIDSGDYYDYEDGIRGPGCCHQGDNPTAFSYYEENNCWFCWTNGCQSEKGSDPIGLVAVVKDVERNRAIPMSREFVENMILTGEISKLSESAIKKEVKKEDYCRSHLEQKTYDSYLGGDLSYGTNRDFDSGVLSKMGCGNSTQGVMSGRLVFPIKNIRGQIVGFSGRLQGQATEAQPKWKHSRFRKSVNLLNIDLCHEAMKEWGADTVILTEGPWDVARLCQAGFWNSMATLGAGISTGQTEILKGMGVSRVILFMDNDDGGRNHEEQNTQKLSRASFKVDVLYPPEEGQDVGDMTTEQIKDALRSISK